MSAILDVQPAPPPAIELPPADVTPTSVRAALSRYAADPSRGSLAELVADVDLAGHRWEQQIAARAIEARAELVECCRRAAGLCDELASLHAAAWWLQSFPSWSPRWSVEPYALHVDGHQVAVTELLAAIEDTCAVDARLIRIGRQYARSTATRWPSRRPHG